MTCGKSLEVLLEEIGKLQLTSQGFQQESWLFLNQHIRVDHFSFNFFSKHFSENSSFKNLFSDLPSMPPQKSFARHCKNLLCKSNYWSLVRFETFSTKPWNLHPWMLWWNRSSCWKIWTLLMIMNNSRSLVIFWLNFLSNPG